MKLTCPECSTQFLIQDDAIGSNGRTVRCSQCSATWFVAAEPDVLDLRDNINEGQHQQDYVRRGGHEEEDFEAPFEKHANDGSSVPPEFGAHTIIRDQADKKRVRRQLFGVGMIWIVTLAILALAAAAAFLFRSQIVEKFPATRPIYEGFNIEASETGLEIYDIDTSFGENDGVQVLYVNGKIKNYDVKARNVGLVRLNFKNSAGETVTNWVVQPPKSALAPGETMNFSSQYPNPPIDAVSLAPEFVDEVVTPEQ